LRAPLPRIFRTLKNQDSSSSARATFPRLRGKGRAAFVPLLFPWRQVFRGDDGNVATASFQILHRKKDGHQSASAFGIDAQRRTTPIPYLSKTACFCTVTRSIDADWPPGEIIRTMPGVCERRLHETRQPVTPGGCKLDESGQSRNRPWQRTDQSTGHAGDDDHGGRPP
jgi:hypothetical protein